MYLDLLNSKEKVLFIDLAVHVSQANGSVDESEKDIIDQCCKEMGIDSYDITALHSVDEIKAAFSGSDESIKRAAVLELLGIGYTDGSFDEPEDSLIRDFALAIGISKETYGKLIQDVNDYSAVIGTIHKHIFREHLSGS